LTNVQLMHSFVPIASPAFCARRGTATACMFTKPGRNHINVYNKLTSSQLRRLWICGWNRKKLWGSLAIYHYPLALNRNCQIGVVHVQAPGGGSYAPVPQSWRRQWLVQCLAWRRSRVDGHGIHRCNITSITSQWQVICCKLPESETWHETDWLVFVGFICRRREAYHSQRQ